MINLKIQKSKFIKKKNKILNNINLIKKLWKNVVNNIGDNKIRYNYSDY